MNAREPNAWTRYLEARSVVNERNERAMSVRHIVHALAEDFGVSPRTVHRVIRHYRRRGDTSRAALSVKSS